MIRVEHKERRVEFDIMRIAACFCVIMIHCAVFKQEESYAFDSWSYQAIHLWGTLSRWSVPAFVMLSGMLILPHADETSVKRLILHRVLRMIAAYILWSAVYSFYNTYVLGIVYAPTKLKTFVDGCFSGEIHMWYLPMLAGMYLASPILAQLMKKMDRKWLLYWVVCLFVFSSVIPFLIHLNIKYLSTIIGSFTGYMDLQFFGGWTLYYLLGCLVRDHRFSLKEKRWVYALALVSFLFTFYGTVIYSFRHKETMGVLPYEYPNIMFFSLGVFLFVKDKMSGISFGTGVKKWIVEISQLTFGIYLIHVLLLKIWYRAGVNLQICHPLLSIPLVSLIVFASAAAIVWLLRRIPYLRNSGLV